MKKKLLLFLIILFLCGCQIKDNNIIIEKENIEYGENITIQEIIKLKEGNITNNYKIDTTTLGKKTIDVTYEDDNKVKTAEIEINIVDTTPPVMNSGKNYYTVKGEDIALSEIIFCGDNYDKNVTCTVEGDYDINTIGDYNIKFVATDTSNNKNERDAILHVIEEENTDEPITHDIKNVIKKYKTNNTEIGIDVSEWQYDIDWEEVKNAGVEFAFIRIGFGPDEEGNIVIDETFIYNITKAKEVGIKVGIYFYSYALTPEEAEKEANWIIETLNNETLDLPIAFDWENWSKFKEYNLNFFELNNIKDAFINTIKEKGYDAINYGSAFFLNTVWNTNNDNIWMAHYTDKTDYEKPFDYWQFTSTGIVSGIDTYADINIMYIK